MAARIRLTGVLRHRRAITRLPALSGVERACPERSRTGREHKGLAIYAWVILDNHLHAIIAAPDLSAVLRDLKSFTAKQLIGQIKLERREWSLNQLRHYRAAHKPNEYQLWQEGSHPQCILHDEMMEQKRTYPHNNPVKRGWVSEPEHWRYSSAHEWMPGAQPMLRCAPWR